MKKCYILVCSLFLSLISHAQSPERMSYQTIVRDTAGKVVVNQLVEMKISVIKKTINGTAVYVETHRPMANANGLVTLEIGGGEVVFGEFSSINWGDGPFYLKTQIDPSGDSVEINYTISGTTQLLSVPHALFAKSTELRLSDFGDTLFSGSSFVLLPKRTYAELILGKWYYDDEVEIDKVTGESIVVTNSELSSLEFFSNGTVISTPISIVQGELIDSSGITTYNYYLKNNYLMVDEGLTDISSYEIKKLTVNTFSLIVEENDLYVWIINLKRK